MPSSLNWIRPARLACLALATWLMAACGGGSQVDGAASPGAALNAAQVAAAPNAAPNKQRQSTTVNADGPATALVVRAHGVLAGDVGPLMQVWVNGVLVTTVEVRATIPTDYPVTVPALQMGSKLDLVFTNDGTVGTANRDLFITHVMAGKTLVLPTAPDVTYDRGLGAGAFDGVDVIPGRSAMGWNGALRLAWPAPNLTEQITVRANATLLDNTGALMSLRVDGITVGTVEVRATAPTDFVFAVPAVTAGSRLDVVHTNFAASATDASNTRTLTVHNLRAGNTVLLPNASGNVFDLGTGLAAFDGLSLLPPQATLAASGALRGRWPAANMTDTITVRASGSPAGGVAPAMQVLVDGVVLGTASVGSAAPANFSFATLPMKPGNQVQVLFTNPGTAGTETRKLDLAYAIAGKTYLLASNGSLNAPWPEPNLTDTLTVRAKGMPAAGVAPSMQVRVDGIAIGTVDLRNTDFADITLPAPPMQAGRKVDVVLLNGTGAAGSVPNLQVAYLTAGSTFVRASGTGTVQATWPQPNITSTVTVRASGTLAGNVGPVLRLWVDGIAVSRVEVRATTPTDYTLPTPPLQPGSKIDVTFDNPETVAGVQRTLSLAYLLAGTTVLKPSSAGAVYTAGNLQATWPAANLTDSLTVRAYGMLAGDVGPIMQVLVDGVMVGTQEVRATDPTDYTFQVPALQSGTKIDVVYTNDGMVNAVDRNLFVQQLMSSKTYQLANAPNVVYDRGTGAAAFDGLDLIANTGVLHSNGALRMAWPAPNLTSTVTVRASGMPADGAGPVMALRVDGAVVGSTEVRASDPADHVFAVPPLAAGSRLDVVFTNSAASGGQARQLKVHYLMAGTTVLLPAAAGNVFDAGSGLAAFDGVNLQPAQTALAGNGALRGKWPVANMTDTLTLRASSPLTGGTVPMLQVLVDGVVLGTAAVRSTTPTDLQFAALPLATGAQVQVRNTQGGSVTLAYALAGKTVLRPPMLECKPAPPLHCKAPGPHPT